MKLLNLDNSPLMDVSAISQDNNDLIIKGTIMGAMPMTCKLTPAEARGMLKMLTPGLFFFLLSFLFRSSKSAPRK